MGTMVSADAAEMMGGENAAKRSAENVAEGSPAMKVQKVEAELPVKKEEDEKDKKEKKEKEKDKENQNNKENDRDKKVAEAARPIPTGSGGMSAKELAAFDVRKMFKEGQKFMTPIQADSTRAFYESLLQENPESKIAIRYCVEYGVLPLEQHKRLLKKFKVLTDKGVYNARAQALANMKNKKIEK